MFGGTENLLSLADLAERLRLPKGWLKAEADAGRIPHLKIGRRYRFNPAAVTKVLAEMAAGKNSRPRRSLLGGATDE